MRTIAHSSLQSSFDFSPISPANTSTKGPTFPIPSSHVSKGPSLRRNIHSLNLHPQDIPGLMEHHGLDTHFLSTFSRNTLQTVAQTHVHRTALSANKKRILGNAMGLLAIVAQLHILSRGKLSPAVGLGIVGACTASHTLRSLARLMSYSLLARALLQASCGSRHAQVSLCAAAAGAFLGRAVGKFISNKLPTGIYIPSRSADAQPQTVGKFRPVFQALQQCSKQFKKVDKPIGQWIENCLNSQPRPPLIEPLLTLRISPEPTHE